RDAGDGRIRVRGAHASGPRSPRDPRHPGHVTRIGRGPPARKGRRSKRLHRQGRIRPGPPPSDHPGPHRSREMTKIRVLVVEDSVTVRKRLVEVLADDPGLEVVGEGGDGKEAIELCQRLRPDVMTLDMMLPVM